MRQSGQINLPDKRYFRIGEVCKITGLKPHVLRYWETEFKQIKPQKTKSNQRLYRKKDVENIITIKNLLYDKKFTIAGAKARLEEERKDRRQAPQQPRQMAIEFDPAERDRFIQSLADELKSIRDILDRD